MNERSGVAGEYRLTAMLLWAASIALLLGAGVGLVWWPSSLEIASMRTAARAYYDQTVRNEDDVRRSALIGEVRSRVASDFRGLGSGRSRAATTAEALRVLATEATAHAVEVRSIAPIQPAREIATSQTIGESDDLEIQMRGRFVDILALVAELPRHGALLEPRDLSLSTAASGPPGARLDATLHVALFTVRLPVNMEERHASGIVR